MRNSYLTSVLIIFLSISSFGYAHDFKVLIFSKTNNFTHGSIPDGIAMIEQLGIDNEFDVEATEDASLFTFENLQQYAAVIFLSTEGEVLNNEQQAAFEQYIQSGGGYVGIHSASDTEFNWSWYGDLVGAYFSDHPSGTAQADIKVSDRVHPSTTGLPFSWTRTDEWYNFRENPRESVHILATLDESSYSGGTMGYDHPISWCHEFDGGRAWYTAGGHTNESYREPLFIQHVLGGIYYAVQEITGNFDATVDQNFEITVIDNNPSNPMALAVLPDLRLLYVERGGAIKLYNPETGALSTVASLDVDSNREDGLLGIVLDPNFETNNWMYVFYSPEGSEDKQHLSRFTFTGNTVDLSSEKILIEIPTQREECCHSGGDLEFDKNGNLYISLGDNTNPFQSNGYTPIDERSGRESFDAQRTSANTKDFRGKILRIKPENDGTYSIPSGNLFTDANEGFPEIFTMGHRNPFRITVGADDYLYVGEVGPDASSNSNTYGPSGHDEFNRTNVAANFGWPYCIADNQSYVDYNFGTSQSGTSFDCDNPINNSPNNTGATVLPAATPAWIWYNGGASIEFPSMDASGGRTAMAGAVYQFDDISTSDVKFPEYYHNSVFLYEWSRNWIREVKLDDLGNIVKINPFLGSLELKRPIDMDFGPDGAMYIIEWGTGFTGNNADARIIKISYKNGNRTPIAIVTADPAAGVLPLTVDFSSQESYDPDPDNILSYEWDFDGDGTFDATGATVSHTYTVRGTFNALLKVMDNEGLSSFATVVINAGNSIPDVMIESPVNGGFFIWGEEVPFKINVSDPEDGSTEDGSINCSDVSGLASIGHDDHIHDLNAIANCEGSFVTQSHGEEAENVFYVFRGNYTDQGVVDVASITGSDSSVLQPKKKEAEHFSSQQGIQIENTTDPLGGGNNVGYIENGDYISFAPMNLKNITHITFRAASEGNGGFVEIRTDAPDGPLLGQRYLPITGGWQEWDYFTMPIQDPGGTHELFFVFSGNAGYLFNLNWIEFHGQGVATNDLNAAKGLNASYYNNTDFSGTAIQTKDPLIAFDWAEEAPVNGINAASFSVRWNGFLEVDTTDDYTLFTNHQGGSINVSLNGEELINKTTDGKITTDPITLTNGEKYPIIVEYVHTGGNAAVSLGWGDNQTIYMSNLNALEVKVGVKDFVNSEDVQVHPNPFNTSFTISPLKGFSSSKISLHSLSGDLIENWEIKEVGEDLKFENLDLQTGIYFLHIQTSKGTVFKKIIKM